MKATIHLSSHEEFVTFLLTTSSLYLRCDYFEKQEEGNSLPKYFIRMVDRVVFPGSIYLFRALEEIPLGENHDDYDFSLINYMFNDAQIESENVVICFDGCPKEPEIDGVVDVADYLLEDLPVKFILRVGWKTKYEEFIVTHTSQ